MNEKPLQVQKSTADVFQPFPSDPAGGQATRALFGAKEKGKKRSYLFTYSSRFMLKMSIYLLTSAPIQSRSDSLGCVQGWVVRFTAGLRFMLLQDQLDEKKKHPFCIEGMKEYHTENTVHFHITLSAAHMATAEKLGLQKAFKLETALQISNMMLFDVDGKVQKFLLFFFDQRGGVKAGL